MGAVGRRHDPTSKGLTACRMRGHLAAAAPGLRPAATPARRPRLRLPGTTGPRFALHGRQHRIIPGATRFSEDWRLSPVAIGLMRVGVYAVGKEAGTLRTGPSGIMASPWHLGWVWWGYSSGSASTRPCSPCCAGPWVVLVALGGPIGKSTQVSKDTSTYSKGQ